MGPSAEKVALGTALAEVEDELEMWSESNWLQFSVWHLHHHRRRIVARMERVRAALLCAVDATVAERVAVAALIETGRHNGESARDALARAVERLADYDARVTPPDVSNPVPAPLTTNETREDT